MLLAKKGLLYILVLVLLLCLDKWVLLLLFSSITAFRFLIFLEFKFYLIFFLVLAMEHLLLNSMFCYCISLLIFHESKFYLIFWVLAMKYLLLILCSVCFTWSFESKIWFQHLLPIVMLNVHVFWCNYRVDPQNITCGQGGSKFLAVNGIVVIWWVTVVFLV